MGIITRIAAATALLLGGGAGAMADDYATCRASSSAAFMLEHIDSKCPGYRLTERGRLLLEKNHHTAASIASQLGNGRCIFDGTQGVIDQAYSLHPETKGDPSALAPFLCQEIYIRLTPGIIVRD